MEVNIDETEGIDDEPRTDDSRLMQSQAQDREDAAKALDAATILLQHVGSWAAAGISKDHVAS